jgi:Cys-tRNA(Pro)/Cys-tRNA(Cys) deacylase
MKTNAMRLLDGFGIPYSTRDYIVNPEDLSAETVAAKLDLPAEQVFKTLVVKGDGSAVCLAVIPGNQELDLKALAKLSGNRKMEMAPLGEVQPLTGYVRGGVTALGAKKDYDVYLDETAQIWDVISISAGIRGTQIVLRPDDYVKATNAIVGAISRHKHE